MENTKVKKRRKIWIGLFAGLAIAGAFGASSGIFLSDLLTNTSSEEEVVQPTKTYANTISENSLNDYWDNVDSSKLVDSKVSLSSLIDQQGAVYENLVASENYIATSTVNEIVSTTNTVNHLEVESNKDAVETLFKTTVKKAADKLYEFGTADITDVEEFVTRMNALNDLYPEFKKKFIDDYAQGLGIWSNPNFLNYDQENTAFEAPRAAFESQLTPLYLRENYRSYFVQKATPLYSSMIYNAYEQALGAGHAWTNSIMGSMKDGIDSSTKTDITYKGETVSTELYSAMMMYNNDENWAEKGLSEYVSYNVGETKAHWSNRQDYIGVAAGIASPCAIVCAIAAAALSPSKWFEDAELIDWFWDEDTFLSAKMFNYQVPFNPTVGSLAKNAVPKTGTTKQLNPKVADLIDNYDEEVNWNENTMANYYQKGVSEAERFDSRIGGTRGRNQASADLEFLTDVYFDKAEGEWRKEINKYKADNKFTYFDNFISEGDINVFSQLDGKAYTIFQMAIRNYLYSLNKEATDKISAARGGYLQDNGTTLIGGGHVKRNRLDALRAAKPVYSEANKKRIFKRELDKLWNKYSVELTEDIKSSLESNKKDATTEFEVAKDRMKAILQDPFTSNNFKVHDYETDLLGQKKIKRVDEDGNQVNFSIIPENNTKVSPYGFDKNSEDVLNNYITKNIILTSFLEKNGEISELLKTKSPPALRAYVTSLFEYLKNNIYSHLARIFTKYSDQAYELFEEYIDAASEGINRRLTKDQYNKYILNELAPLQKQNEDLLDLDVKSVQLSEGFLLSILNVKKYNDPNGELKTIFELIDEDEELQTFIKEASLRLAKI